jgi:hypothetical protein
MYSINLNIRALNGPTLSSVGSSVARWYFFKPKIQIWVMFGRSGNRLVFINIILSNVGTAKCCILWPFGTISGQLVYFSPFWYVVQRKIWQPWLAAAFSGSVAGHQGEPYFWLISVEKKLKKN